MPTNVQVSFRFALKIAPSSGVPAYSSMTPQQKVAAKSELLAPVDQEEVAEVVEEWSSVAIPTDACCEITDVTLRAALQEKLDESESELTGALGFMPTLAAGAATVHCTELPDKRHICNRSFSLQKGASGPAWSETSATYEITAPIVLTATWTTPAA